MLRGGGNYGNASFHNNYHSNTTSKLTSFNHKCSMFEKI